MAKVAVNYSASQMIVLTGDVAHTESAWEWPTDELKTMVMLTNK